jgi:hypothetical protein
MVGEPIGQRDFGVVHDQIYHPYLYEQLALESKPGSKIYFPMKYMKGTVLYNFLEARRAMDRELQLNNFKMSTIAHRKL